MSAQPLSNSGLNQLLESWQERGQWKQSITKGRGPIFSALILIGLVGLAVGAATLGSHQQWWVAGELSRLSSTHAIIISSSCAGGIILGGIGVGFLIRAYRKRNLYFDALNRQPVNTFTIIPNEDGTYQIIAKDDLTEFIIAGKYVGRLRIVKRDCCPGIKYDLCQMALLNNRFISTDPDPTRLMFSDEV